MPDFIFKISPNIILGSYTSSRLGQFVREWGTRYMLILDPVLEEFGTSSKIEESLKDRSINYFVFDEIPQAPDTTVVAQALRLAREAHVHGVISVGGPKTANIGRAVCALFNESHDIYDFTEGAQPTSGSLPFITVPTTIRDSFLFSDTSPLIDARSRQLKMLKLQPALCRLALFDPNLTVTLTESQSVSMILHTVCIAIEAYISQKANFFSDTIIEKAVELLGGALTEPSALTASSPKEQLALEGGCMTSLGVSSSSIGAGTLLAHAINARYKLATSLTATVFLPYIIEDAAKYKTEKLAKLARIMHAAADTSSNEAAVSALAETIRSKIAAANLPARLKDLSVSIEQLALAAEDAAKLDCMNAMPRSMTADDLFDIIKQAF
ncbi:iron-containing alcohol dehydrogenase [Treponema lecithinolyticum]|uniref:Alcohol dehydrogenase, iron-dependent n=3 Tax=Treponema lecithinolyticum TaxID=53418 RepID=A0ABN0NWV0_TRELE|nr:iron-containing alcohol dehydrogenase [Treponema lecithinolyticum]ERJ91880.1 alcohol dehydrogenase, iron-dependent [Treponema lecithinolyticum ATCC 700332]